MNATVFHLGDLVMRFLRLGGAILREIFDESAYERFLARHRANSSRHAYSAFLREQAQVQCRRHRCC